MAYEKTKSLDYQTIKSNTKNGSEKRADESLVRPSKKVGKENNYSFSDSLRNPQTKADQNPSEPVSENLEQERADNFLTETNGNLDEKWSEETEEKRINLFTGEELELTYSEQKKKKKLDKKEKKDQHLLTNDNWLARNGHTLTYIGLYLFSIVVLFRPYELSSHLEFLSATAFYFAALTLALYIPSQLFANGDLTTFSTEVKAVLILTLIAALSIVIAKSPRIAWDMFNDIFIKAVAMFIVMVNVLRTKERLMGMVWLSLSVGIYLGYSALDMYINSEFTFEGYRIGGEIGGLFGNPNDLALHLVLMTPLAITLGIVADRKWKKTIYFLMAVLFIAANTVTYSRGGFLGLLAMSLVLVWKLGRKNRAKVFTAFAIVGGLFILFAPGNYGLRMLSIFIPGLDPVGSSDQRQDLLIRSIIVSIRNPWGIGIGNFPVVGYGNLGTHNSYTQISSELGILGLGAYLTFIISPFRKLAAMERTLFENEDSKWFYYLAIGFQASIIGFMVCSFFGAVAYNWFIYYLIAYVVGFRRIYQVSELTKEKKAKLKKKRMWQRKRQPEGFFWTSKKK